MHEDGINMGVTAPKGSSVWLEYGSGLSGLGFYSCM
jgi:hypothetical protein